MLPTPQVPCTRHHLLQGQQARDVSINIQEDMLEVSRSIGHIAQLQVLPPKVELQDVPGGEEQLDEMEDALVRFERGSKALHLHSERLVLVRNSQHHKRAVHCAAYMQSAFVDVIGRQHGRDVGAG